MDQNVDQRPPSALWERVRDGRAGRAKHEINNGTAINRSVRRPCLSVQSRVVIVACGVGIRALLTMQILCTYTQVFAAPAAARLIIIIIVYWYRIKSLMRERATANANHPVLLQLMSLLDLCQFLTPHRRRRMM